MKTERMGVKLFRTLRIGGDGGDMVNATDCSQGWLLYVSAV
jgi:hypothetical protein